MPRPTTRLRLTSLEDRLTPAGGLDAVAINFATVAEQSSPTSVPPPAYTPLALDPAYGTDGRAALRPVTPGPFIYPDVTKVIGLAGGKSLVFGRLDGLFVQRLNADGTPDASFGVNGRVELKDPDIKAISIGATGLIDGETFGPADPRTQINVIAAATVTPDGGVLVVGSVNMFTPDGFYGTMRFFKFTSSGALDTAYVANANAAGGFAPVEDGKSGSDIAAGVVALPDGRVVVAGTTGLVTTNDSVDGRGRAAVLRLKADGTLDTSFGVGGRVTFGTETVSNTDPARPFPDAKQSVGLGAVALDGTGRILLAGSAYPLLSPSFTRLADIPTLSVRAFAARLTADGALDTTFDADGVATITLPAGSRVNDAAGTAIGSGRFGAVLVGLRGSDGQFATAQLTPAGQTDTAYGVGGLTELESATGSNQPVVDVVIRPGGATIVATVMTTPRAEAQPQWGIPGFPETTVVRLVEITENGKPILPLTEIRFANVGESVNGRSGAAFAIDHDGNVTAAGGVQAEAFVTGPDGNVQVEADPRIVVVQLAQPLPLLIVEPPIVEPPVVVTVTPQPVRVPGDVNGDGLADNLVTDGPRLAVTSGKDGSVLVAPFAPFEASYTGKLNVVFVDLDGEGKSELVVSPSQGGGPIVAVYNADGTERGRFWGIDDAGFRGGVSLAAGDVDGDGRPDLIVTAGEGGGPRVAIFDGQSLGANSKRLVADFFAFENSQRGGATAGVAGGVLIFAAGPGGGPRVRGVDARSLFAPEGVKSLDDLPASARKFDRFVGDSSSRRGVKLDFSGVDDSVSDRPNKVTASSGDGQSETVYETPGFGPAT